MERKIITRKRRSSMRFLTNTFLIFKYYSRVQCVCVVVFRVIFFDHTFPETINILFQKSTVPSVVHVPEFYEIKIVPAAKRDDFVGTKGLLQQ